MYISTISTWAARNLDVGQRTRALRELPGYVGMSPKTISNHWNGLAKVRPELASKYVEYFNNQLGLPVETQDVFTAIPLTEPVI